jgi:hypothetical protein
MKRNIVSCTIAVLAGAAVLAIPIEASAFIAAFPLKRAAASSGVERVFWRGGWGWRHGRWGWWPPVIVGGVAAAPVIAPAIVDPCWRRVLSPWGWRWAWVC